MPLVPPAEFAPHEAALLRERIAKGDPVLVLLRSTICPYGAAFRSAFFEIAKARGLPATDLLVVEGDAAQWDAWSMRISPTVLRYEGGREVARLEGKPLLGLTRKAFQKWLTPAARR